MLFLLCSHPDREAVESESLSLKIPHYKTDVKID